MAEKVLNIIMYVLAILLMVAVVVAIVYALVSTYQDKEIEKEILSFLENDTEDEGDYVILLQPCTASILSDHPEARAYYAWMTDANGDTEMLVVRYNAPGDIETFEVWWETAP